MVTRSKKSRAFLAWLCFFLGVNLFIALAVVGLAAAEDIVSHFDDIMAIIRWDIKDTSRFKEDISERFEHLMRVVTGTDYMESYVSTFRDEGENLLYYAENLITGKKIGNVDKEAVLARESATTLDGTVLQAGDKVILPQGYDYYLYYNGTSVMAQNRNRPVNVYSERSGYQDTWLGGYLKKGIQHPEIRILLMVRKDIAENPYGISSLYRIWQRYAEARWLCFGFIGAIVLDFVLMLIALLKRRTKREFDETLARISGRVWFEVKAILSLLVLLFLYQLWENTGDTFLSCMFSLCGLWWFYIMLVDWRVNRKRFFTHNSITWLVGVYRRFESRKPFQKALLWRIHALVAAEVVLVFLAFCFAVAGNRAAPIAMFFVAAGFFLLYLYLKNYRQTVDELGLLVDRIADMKNGKYETASSLSPNSDLRMAWENLTHIQNGIQKAVEEKLKSERMKMELITNVSHDLKTPLTSIISYTDLIAREEGLPDTVKDYVRILSQKADRLKTLIQDLFELSRAASGNMVLNMERLDLGRLLEQTLADMNEEIEESGLIFKVKIPDAPVYVLSDGRRLYRVFQNLISNALKYSMDRSRVYVDLTVDQHKAKVEIKNIANYEMNFDADEIVERFVRGDKARSTEGSGLGLAIASSFTHACGGSFDISIDGDLFKVTLVFSRLDDDIGDRTMEEEAPDSDAGGYGEETAQSLDEADGDTPLLQGESEVQESGVSYEDAEDAEESPMTEDACEDSPENSEGASRPDDGGDTLEENEGRNSEDAATTP